MRDLLNAFYENKDLIAYVLIAFTSLSIFLIASGYFKNIEVEVIENMHKLKKPSLVMFVFSLIWLVIYFLL